MKIFKKSLTKPSGPSTFKVSVSCMVIFINSYFSTKNNLFSLSPSLLGNRIFFCDSDCLWAHSLSEVSWGPDSSYVPRHWARISWPTSYANSFLIDISIIYTDVTFLFVALILLQVPSNLAKQTWLALHRCTCVHVHTDMWMHVHVRGCGKWWWVQVLLLRSCRPWSLWIMSLRSPGIHQLGQTGCLGSPRGSCMSLHMELQGCTSKPGFVWRLRTDLRLYFCGKHFIDGAISQPHLIFL